MGIVSGGGGGGNTTAQVVASGKVLPVADATGVTVDTTTYNDEIRGGGAKLTTLVFPTDGGALAIALAGDAFPRWVLGADPTDFGMTMSDGTTSPANSAAVGLALGTLSPFLAGVGVGARVTSATSTNHAPRIEQVSPKFAITSGALPTQQLVTGTAAQLADPGNKRDVEAHTPVTFNPGVATTATCTVQISADNVTYSTLSVVTKPVGTVFDGEIDDVVVRLPAGWYIKLTVVNATLGLTTYY